MFGIGPTELIVIFLVVLLLFGAKRIPEIAQGIGKGISEFKKAARDTSNEIESNTNHNLPPSSSQKDETESNSK